MNREMAAEFTRNEGYQRNADEASLAERNTMQTKLLSKVAEAIGEEKLVTEWLSDTHGSTGASFSTLLNVLADVKAPAEERQFAQALCDNFLEDKISCEQFTEQLAQFAPDYVDKTVH